MARVLLTHPLPDRAVAVLTGAGHEVELQPQPGSPGAGDLAGRVAEFDGLVCVLSDRIDAPLLGAGAAGRLRVISTVAVGYDNIDVPTARSLGLVVCNTPGILDETTADLAFLLLLAASRLATESEDRLRSGHWQGWGLMDHLGRDVHGTVLGLVGYGRIARAVARRAEGFSIEVLHFTRTATGLPGEVGSLDELLGVADAISLHVPLTEATHHLIGARELALMKPTAVLVNTARGAVVDEDALADALETGGIFAAGLDVFSDEPRVSARLRDAPRTVLLPHIGSATVATRTKMAVAACQSVCDVLAGRPSPNAIPA